jgi:hypothetical protein
MSFKELSSLNGTLGYNSMFVKSEKTKSGLISIGPAIDPKSSSEIDMDLSDDRGQQSHNALITYTK